MSNPTCDLCDLPAVTQVTIGISYGLFCAEHGAVAHAERLDRIRRNNRKAAR